MPAAFIQPQQVSGNQIKYRQKIGDSATKYTIPAHHRMCNVLKLTLRRQDMKCELIHSLGVTSASDESKATISLWCILPVDEGVRCVVIVTRHNI